MDDLNQLTPVSKVVQDLQNSGEIEDHEAIECLLKKLLNKLEFKEDEFTPEVVSLLLGPTAKVLPLDELYSPLLQTSLPLTKHFLFKKFELNHQLIEEASVFENDSLVPNLLKNIEDCINILLEVDSLLAYLTSFDKISTTNLCSAPKQMAEIVLLVFSHCQTSQTKYKDVFTTVKNELMSLFQQCYQVQVKLYTLLNEKLDFDCSNPDILQDLVDVLQTLDLLSEVVAELDTMSLVAHWKGYAQLMHKYSDHLTLNRPVFYLTANIAHQLDNLKVYVNAEKKVVLRALKISSLLLKVLIKLCETFQGSLEDCHQPLLSCLVSLTARTSQTLCDEGLSDEIAAQVMTHLCAGAAPLLTHLLGDPEFAEAYFQHADELQSSSVGGKLGYCNLTNMILKKLIHLSSVDDEAKQVWVKPSLPLIETTFKILHHCAEVFLVYDDMYQSLLTHSAAFVIATTSAVVFPTLERLLFRQLLQPSLWPAFFTSDLLCLIARVGSSKLCLQLAVLLSDLCAGWPAWDRCRPEWCYVNWTLGRITRFLAVDDLKTFPSRLPAVATVGADINTLLDKRCLGEPLQLYESVIVRLTVLKDRLTLMPDARAALTQPVYRLWQHMTLPADLSIIENTNWFCALFSILVPVTSHIIDGLDNAQVDNVLDMLEKLIACNATIFKCGTCSVLKSLAGKCFLNDTNQALVFNRMSSLFVKLLLDRNPLVKQFAFEAFSYFAHVTKHEEIVASTVAKDSKLQIEITQYLEGIPIVKSKTDFLQYISNLNSPFVHKCKSNQVKAICEDDGENNPCKKFKSSAAEEPVSGVLQKIEKDLGLIKEFSKCSEDMKKSVLQCISNRLNEMVKTF